MYIETTAVLKLTLGIDHPAHETPNLQVFLDSQRTLYHAN